MDNKFKILLNNGKIYQSEENPNCNITGLMRNKERCKNCNNECKLYIIHHISEYDNFIVQYFMNNKNDKEKHICNNKYYFKQLYVGSKKIIEYDDVSKSYSITEEKYE